MYSVKGKDSIKYPILVSSPHSGREFPKDLSPVVKQKFKNLPEDTDWYVDDLYDFSQEMGFVHVYSNISRYVIDLNRDVNGLGLYSDGRQETGLVPLRSFSGENLYESEPPSSQEIKKRIEEYYLPYHNMVKNTLFEIKNQFGVALLFEAHSIKRNVKTIREQSFPDFILGNQGGKTCPKAITGVLEEQLRASGYEWSDNDPFRGGFLTRTMAELDSHIYTVQLEMSQDLYMNEVDYNYLPEKAEQVQKFLKSILQALGNELLKMVRK